MRALDYARTQLETPQEECSSPRVYLHSYWDGPFATTARLSLVSGVYAHPPGCAFLTVHSETDESALSIREMLQPFLGSHFAVKVLDGMELMSIIKSKHSNLTLDGWTENKLAKLAQRPDGFSRTAFSDLVRVLVLSAYGGVYLDSEVLVLKPLDELG